MWVALDEAEPSRITAAVELLSEIRVACRLPGMVNAQENWRSQPPGVGGVTEPPGTLIILESMVTAPMRAKARPSSVAPVWSAIDWSARIFPFMTEVVPMVAELPTCQ